MKILLVDDHSILRAGLRALLCTHMDAELTEAPDARSAKDIAFRVRPDLAVVDLVIPGTNGYDLIAELVALRVPVLVLSMHSQPQYADSALKAGANGYISKSASPETFLDAVKSVSAGRSFIEPAVAQSLALSHLDLKSAHKKMTLRDFELLRLLADGLTLAEIAGQLRVSLKTIANNASLLRAKLNIKHPADLVVAARRLVNDPMQNDMA